MTFSLRAVSALALAGIMLTGCAADNNGGFTTGALGTQAAAAPEPKIDPACVVLASRIEGLRKEGIADKIEKAAAKKYKMTHADLVKADQLTKVSAEFQGRCSTTPPKPITAQVSSPPVATASPPPAAKPAAKKAAAVQN